MAKSHHQAQPEPPPDLQDQEAAFRRFAPDAKALREDEVKIRGDAQLALANARVGVEAVLEQKAVLETKWPAPRVEALNVVIPRAQAAVYAAAQADLAGGSSGLHDKIQRAYALRDKLLSALDTCVKFEVVSAEKVTRLHEGRGPLDAAQSLIHIVGFFHDNAPVLAGKTPVQDGHLAEAQALGNELAREIKPKGSPPRKDPAAGQSDTANRYWTLLALAYDEVHKAGFEIWGRGYEEHVPALGSRVVHKKRAPKEGEEQAPKKPGKGRKNPGDKPSKTGEQPGSEGQKPPAEGSEQPPAPEQPPTPPETKGG